MAIIYIDSKPYEVKDGQNLLHACLSLGFDIPYFCWHPALHSVGACRQCAVKQFRDERDEKGRIVMACMTPAADGTRISIDDPEAKAFRKSVIEWLMVNHPHDCPVCDEGGECHLQDMTLMAGHTSRRFRFRKRSYPNQYLGPLLSHEMNRCIQCYRCVRFYRDYAGGRDLEVFALRDRVFFGRSEDGALRNEFSGNLVEICPTGVFTDKTFKKHYTRKWDLQTAPSICVQCGVGCNTIPAERYRKLRRIRNRYNGEVNRYFLCDRGRYGYEFVNSDQRVREPTARSVTDHNEASGTGARPGKEERMTAETAVRSVAALLASGARTIGIGSPRASLEANFALRMLVGPEHFYRGISDRDTRMVSLIIDILENGPARSPSLRDVESADAILVLGEAVADTAPVLSLALRQAVRQRQFEIAKRLRIPLWDDGAVRAAAQDEKSPLFLVTPHPTKLRDIAALSYQAEPDDIARLGFALAHELDNELSPVEGLDDAMRTHAAVMAQALMNAKRPLVVSGTGCGSEAVIRAAANVAWALCTGEKSAGLSFVVPECNTFGLGLIGGGSLNEAFTAARQGRVDAVVILENDLFLRADNDAVDSFFKNAGHTIVIDHTMTPTASRAGVVLPAAAFAEADGTLVNLEGRAQRFYQVFVPDGIIQESWRWLRDIMAAAGRAEVREWKGLDAVIASLTEALPLFGPVRDIAPPAGFRIAGMRIPRQSHRNSGRTAIVANETVFEPRPPGDPDSPLAFTMEGFPGMPPPALIPRFWAPGWNSPQAVIKFQSEVDGPLRGGDPGRRLIEPSARVKNAVEVAR
ncbi:MAG: NADH-quinone oxidoreductase subunit NuoG [Nitrospirota bacterium]